MICEIFLAFQLTYALVLNPKKLADIYWMFRATLTTGLFLSCHGYRECLPLLDTGYFVSNDFATVLKIVVLLTVIFLFAVISRSGSELPFMMTLATLFLLLLLSSSHFMATFFALVGLSLNLYVLVLFDASYAASREAALKYYYLSVISSGFILYGIFIIFVACGSLSFDDIAVFTALCHSDDTMRMGLGLLLLGFFFKLSAFPGHQ